MALIPSFFQILKSIEIGFFEDAPRLFKHKISIFYFYSPYNYILVFANC